MKGSRMHHLNESMISGALYHLVATYSVRLPPMCSSGTASKPRLKPKSQIFNSQSEFTNRLPGFRSRWMTEAECIYFIPVFV